MKVGLLYFRRSPSLPPSLHSWRRIEVKKAERDKLPTAGYKAPEIKKEGGGLISEG